MMKKISKLLALIILPILAISVFAGCGKGRSFAECYTYFQQIQQKYCTLDGKIANPTEKYTKLHYTSADSSIFNVSAANEVNATFEIDYSCDDFSKEAGDVGDNDRNARYYAVSAILPQTLNSVMQYYDTYNQAFYSTVEQINMQKGDGDTLYRKMVDFSSSLKDFVAAKTTFEELCSATGIDTIAKSTIVTYTKNYVDLISSAIDFVECFKDMQLKYLYANPYTTEGDTTERVSAEATLNLAKIVYMENFKSYISYSTCDLSEVSRKVAPKINSVYMAVPSYVKPTYYLMVKDTTEPTRNLSSVADVNKIYSFNQRMSLYESAYSQVNFYEYNQARMNDTQTDYISKQNDLTKANLQLLDDFILITAQQYFNNY